MAHVKREKATTWFGEEMAHLYRGRGKDMVLGFDLEMRQKARGLSGKKSVHNWV
jgi:hypothetical protein